MQNVKGARVGNVTFTCPNSYCKRTITRSVWDDGIEKSAYACCNCGAQLRIVADIAVGECKITEVRWINKKIMDSAKNKPQCEVCLIQIAPGASAHYRGFTVHKGNCLQKIQGISVKHLLLNRTSILMETRCLTAMNRGV